MTDQPDIGYLLNRATRLSRLRLADALAGTGLTAPQAAALMAIARSSEGVSTPSALADAIDADQATVSGLVNRLNRDGWIEVRQNPRDGRSRLVVLSPKAMKTLPSVVSAAATASVQLSACLSADEVSVLTRLLHRMCEVKAGPAAETSGS